MNNDPVNRQYQLHGIELHPSFYLPPRSPWTCYLFGNRPGGTGLVWHPRLGEEPNWFWRKMQYLLFGNLWIKENS